MTQSKQDDTQELRRQAFRLITLSYALMIAIILGVAAVIVARTLAPECVCPTAEKG